MVAVGDFGEGLGGLVGADGILGEDGGEVGEGKEEEGEGDGDWEVHG